MMNLTRYLLLVLAVPVGGFELAGQFLDPFDGSAATVGATPQGWSYATGDGNATMRFVQDAGFATIHVDATRDQRNIWWALIKTRVGGLDMDALTQPDYELRAEARIRVSHAPRRVNLHFNHQRTTDYHSHLMEFDIPDPGNWHTISMTTRGFQVQQGDQINAQMALMDWGQEAYQIDIDYFKVDVVPAASIDNDLGNPIPYHPPVPDADSFSCVVPVSDDVMIDSQYPDLNFNDWQIAEPGGAIPVQSVSGSQIVILKWDLDPYKNRQAAGPGLLELSTFTLQRSPAYQKDFGMVRVKEILAGNADWRQEFVTMNSFLDGSILNQVVNTQMVIDYMVNPAPFGKSWFVINQQVMNRLLSGKTKGLAIFPLGAVNAAFFSTEATDVKLHPKLLFNLK